MTMPFKTIRSRAEKRKGGPKALKALLPPRPDPKALAKLGDDRVLAEMTRRAFSAGFGMERDRGEMWTGLKRLFSGSSRVRCRCSPDEFWDALIKDTLHRPQRRQDHVGARQREFCPGSGEGAWQLRRRFQLAKWPASDEIGLPLNLLAKAAAAELGKWQHRPDAVAALPRLGRVRDIEGFGRVPARRRAWTSPRRSPRSATSPRCRRSSTSGPRRPACPTLHLSRICAMSIGENGRHPDTARMGGGDE